MCVLRGASDQWVADGGGWKIRCVIRGPGARLVFFFYPVIIVWVVGQKCVPRQKDKWSVVCLRRTCDGSYRHQDKSPETLPQIAGQKQGRYVHQKMKILAGGRVLLLLLVTLLYLNGEWARTTMSSFKAARCLAVLGFWRVAAVSDIGCRCALPRSARLGARGVPMT